MLFYNDVSVSVLYCSISRHIAYWLFVVMLVVVLVVVAVAIVHIGS